MDERPEDASGVNTPSRFAQGYDSPRPLSSRHFTATIDQKLHEAQSDDPRRPSRPAARQAAVEGQQAGFRAGEAGSRDALHEAPAAFNAAGPQFPRHARKTSVSGAEDVRTPRPGSGRHSHSHAQRDDQDGHEPRRTKAFAFYGQVRKLRMQAVFTGGTDLYITGRIRLCNQRRSVRLSISSPRPGCTPLVRFHVAISSHGTCHLAGVLPSMVGFFTPLSSPRPTP